MVLFKIGMFRDISRISGLKCYGTCVNAEIKFDEGLSCIFKAGTTKVGTRAIEPHPESLRQLLSSRYLVHALEYSPDRWTSGGMSQA